MNVERPIPQFADPDFRTVGIAECGEPTVELRAEDRIHIHPAYHARGFATAEPSIHVRTGVVDALRRASASLPRGICLVVYDGLRSLRTQREIADRLVADLRQMPISEGERAEMLARYVAPLPRSECEYRGAPPPHATGAAVDLGLIGEDGRFVDMGADFDQFDDTASAAYFEDRRLCDSPFNRARRDNRRILHWAMIDAGFCGYPAEFWHYELGTRREAAFRNLTTARYGAIAPWPDGGL